MTQGKTSRPDVCPVKHRRARHATHITTRTLRHARGEADDYARGDEQNTLLRNYFADVLDVGAALQIHLGSPGAT